MVGMNAFIAEIEQNSAFTALQFMQGYVQDRREEIRHILHETDIERVHQDASFSTNMQICGLMPHIWVLCFSRMHSMKAP